VGVLVSQSRRTDLVPIDISADPADTSTRVWSSHLWHRAHFVPARSSIMAVVLNALGLCYQCTMESSLLLHSRMTTINGSPLELRTSFSCTRVHPTACHEAVFPGTLFPQDSGAIICVEAAEPGFVSRNLGLIAYVADRLSSCDTELCSLPWPPLCKPREAANWQSLHPESTRCKVRIWNFEAAL
jgi:hypothetical protein